MNEAAGNALSGTDKRAKTMPRRKPSPIIEATDKITRCQEEARSGQQ